MHYQTRMLPISSVRSMCCLTLNGHTDCAPQSKMAKYAFKFEERLPSAGRHAHKKTLITFKKMVEYWARLRDKLEDGEITETEYYFKELKFPMNPIDSDKGIYCFVES